MKKNPDSRSEILRNLTMLSQFGLSLVMPVLLCLGACFLTVIDILSRTITRSELPIGILCALIGTPFFVYLLKKTRGGSWA